MTEINVNIDREALAAAADVLGTASARETVDAALLAVAERQPGASPSPSDAAFEHAWNRLAEIAESGIWDWMSDKSAYRGGRRVPDRHECAVANDAHTGGSEELA
ncbi:hypothetical protein Sru01_02960 [Sphaerisporangium rufum]|uniref:DUF2191 domain-containing protein n=1 Tax=Sphaerisporangium rufum TaxID=1381558 RepID=A0A919UWZ1_9ACTN|nr:hypothetical protein [Sphaerisporangium rufum]GII75314.1 hypothetical protein Sru01_02960 [Sphaerisporangium rufum]